MQACSSPLVSWQLLHSSQTFTTIPRNSRRLLIPGCPNMILPLGIFTLHAFPVVRLYPPMPKGHASDQQMRVGFRMVTKFIDTPRFALDRKVFQSSRSLTTSSESKRVSVLRVSGREAVRSIRSRKWRVSGIAYDACPSRPASDSSSPKEPLFSSMSFWISLVQSLNLLSGRRMVISWVFTRHPRTIWDSAGLLRP